MTRGVAMYDSNSDSPSDMLGVNVDSEDVIEFCELNLIPLEVEL